MPLGKKPVKLKYDEPTRCTEYFQPDFNVLIDDRWGDTISFDCSIVLIFLFRYNYIQ